MQMPSVWITLKIFHLVMKELQFFSEEGELHVPLGRTLLLGEIWLPFLW